MATIVNARDVLLQAAPVRSVTEEPLTESIVASLSSYSAVFPANSDGVVSSWDGGVTTMRVYEGSTEVTNDWTFTTVVSNLTISVSGTKSNTFTVTGMIGDSGYIDITAARTGYPSQTSRFTAAKAKAGTNATPPQALALAASSQVFRVAKDGTATPASITFTATAQNVSGSPTFTVTSGTATLTGTGTTRTLTFENLTSDTATIQVSQGTVTDTITVAKVREGSDAISAFLTNEAHTLPADSGGNVTSWTGASGNFKVYLGAADVSATSTYSVASNPQGVTVSITTAGAYSVTGAGSLPVGTNVATVTLRAVYAGATIDKVLTLTKSKAGANATPPEALALSASSQVFRVAKDGTASPTSITLTATAQNVAGSPTFTVTAGTATLTGTGTTRTLTYANLTTDTATIQVSQGSVTDTITVAKVREGSDAVSAFLTNEAHTLPSDSSGNVTSWTGASGNFKVYLGSADVSATSTYSVLANPQGVTITIDSAGAYSATAPGSLAAGTNVATVTLRATYAGATIDKVFTLTKSKAGTNGTNGTNGSPGSNGQRGTVQVARAISGSTWSNTEANSAISTAGYGSPVNRDMVTLYNTGASYSETRFYDAGSWLTIAAYINGNMLVTGTLSADKLNGGTITGVTINIGSGAFQVSSSGVTSMSGAVGSVMTFGNLWNPGAPPIKAQPVSYSSEPAIYAIAASGNAFKADGPCFLNGNVTIAGSLLKQGGGSIDGSVTYANSSGQVLNSGNAALKASNGTYSAVMQTDGNFVAYGNSTWSAGTNASDAGLKDGVANTKRGGLSVIKALRVVDFRWKPGLKHLSSDREQTGFIAQEVETVLPNAVNEVEHPDLGRVKFLHKEELVPFLVKAVQELSVQVDQLTTRMAAMDRSQNP